MRRRVRGLVPGLASRNCQTFYAFPAQPGGLPKAARKLNAKELFTFDERQKSLAPALGLVVKP